MLKQEKAKKKKNPVNCCGQQQHALGKKIDKYNYNFLQIFVGILLVLPNCVQLNQYFKNKKINQIKEDVLFN